MSNTKQVIVIRKDLNMRKGKMIAQGSHASMAFITKEMHPVWIVKRIIAYFRTPIIEAEEIHHWLNNSFRKICVYVTSEEELKSVYEKAKSNGLTANLIEDNGATEFNGVKTLTCCAIGPHWDEKFIGVTDHLPLL